MWKQVLVLAAMAVTGTGSACAMGQASGSGAKDYSASPIVTKMMAMDKNKDGKLTRDEITDERLMRLFDESDTNKDGVVTREELISLAAKLEAEVAAGGGRGGPGGGGPGGFDGGPPDGGPGGPGRGAPGGRGGFGPPPQPGQVLPGRLQDELNLTDDQRMQVGELQKEVDARLAKILTPEQMRQMKQMRGRGPARGRNGGPGGQGQDR
jgi:hypothetical protein